jgi:hypothetical protein
MVLTRIVFGCLVFVTCALPAPCQTISVVNTSSSVSPTNGIIDIYLKAEPIGKDGNLPKLIVEDVTGSGTSALQLIGEPKFVGRSDTRAYWLTSWHANGQVANLAPVRVLWVRFGTTSELVSIALQKPSAPQVTVTGPGYPLKLGNSHDVPFQIASSVRLTQVVPSFATLIEEKTGQVIRVDQLSIVDSTGSSVNTADGTIVEVPSQVVHLVVTSDFAQPGKFMGNVSLASREKADLGSFAVTIYSTAWWRKLLGGVCLAIGVAIFFGVAIWAKARNKQLLSALPAARFREQAQSLKDLVLKAKDATSVSFATLLGAESNPNSMDFLLNSLSLQGLKSKGYLPQGFFTALSGQDPPPSYQTFLADVGNKLATLEIIVRWGIGSILDRWPNVKKQGKQEAGISALKNLDSLVVATLPPDLLKVKVQEQIAAVDAAISTREALTGGEGQRIVARDVGSREITIQIQELSVFLWVLWGVVTVFVGLCALVLFNDGFGRPQDYIQCVLWGIGMPAVAQGFGGLSAGSVTSALSLPIPR